LNNFTTHITNIIVDDGNIYNFKILEKKFFFEKIIIIHLSMWKLTLGCGNWTLELSSVSIQILWVFYLRGKLWFPILIAIVNDSTIIHEHSDVGLLFLFTPCENLSITCEHWFMPFLFFFFFGNQKQSFKHFFGVN